MAVRKVMLLSDGFFELDMGLLVYGKTSYYGKKYMAALKPLLVITDDHRILVDTGIGDLPERVARYVKVKREATLQNNLRKMGLSPEDISLVINTHLHMDHCGNNRLFEDAKFVVQEDELAYADNPHRFQKNAYVRESFEAVHYATIKGDKWITDEIRAIRTPGHTPGHQSVVVEGERRYIYCGDIAPLRENLERRNIVGVLHNSVEALESLDRLRQMKGIHIFSHDREQMEI